MAKLTEAPFLHLNYFLYTILLSNSLKLNIVLHQQNSPHMKQWIFILVSVFMATTVKATHEAGGQISTRYISSTQQEVKITLWVDSTGINAPSIIYSHQDTTSTTPCTAYLSSATAIGNALMENIYLDTLNILVYGPHKLSYSSCCRSGQITNLNTPATQNFYIFTEFEYNNTLNNSTPEFLNTPDFYANLLDTFLHNPVAADIDNDAMLFYKGNVFGNNGQVIPFTFNPYPFLGWAYGVDSLNGEIHWIPSTTGKYAYTVRVEEWRNGIKISTSYREALINACNGCKTTMSSDFTFQGDGWPVANQYIFLNTYANTPYSFTFSGMVGGNNTNALTLKMPCQPNVHQNKPTFTSVQTGQTVSGTLQWTPQTSQVAIEPYIGVLVGQETNAMNQRRQKEKTVYIKVNPGQPNTVNQITSQSLRVYPNPANNSLRIDFEQPEQQSHLLVLAMDGRCVYQQNITTPTGSILLNTSAWSNGLYRVLYNGKQIGKQILIQH